MTSLRVEEFLLTSPSLTKEHVDRLVADLPLPQEVVVVLQGLPSDLDSEVELVRTGRGAGAGGKEHNRPEGAGTTDPES